MELSLTNAFVALYDCRPAYLDSGWFRHITNGIIEGAVGRGEDVADCYDGTSTEGGLIIFICCYEADLQKIHDS